MPAAPVESQRPIPLSATLALYAAAFAVLAWPWLAGLVTIPGDAKTLYFPQLSFLAHALSEGQSPFWTPHVHSGWPQIADPRALIVSPLHILVALVDPEPGFRIADAVTFAHLFVGGLAIILIFYDRGWHPAGALVAALAFAFGGANASGLSQTLAIESLCWTMLALWLLLHAVAGATRQTAWRWASLTGLVTGLVAVGRNPTALFGLYLLAGVLAWMWLAGPDRWRRLKAASGPLVLGLLVAGLVAGVPLTLTALQTGTAFGAAVDPRVAVHPARLLTAVFADLFAVSGREAAAWGPGTGPWIEAFGERTSRDEPAARGFYGGILIAMAVLGWGIIRGWFWTRDIGVFTVALIAILFYAWKESVDALFIGGALLALSSGYFIHRWLDDAPRQGEWSSRLQVLTIVALIASAITLAGVLDRVSEAVMPILVAILFAGTGIGVLWLARRLNPAHATVSAAVLTVFMVADLGWNNRPGAHTGQPRPAFEMLDPHARNETVTLLKWRLATPGELDRRDRAALAELGASWRQIGQVHRIEQPLGDGRLRGHQEFLDITGVRLFGQLEPVQDAAPELVARTRDGLVYQNADALPRVILYGHWDRADFDAIRRAGAWPAVDPARTGLLERVPEGLKPADKPGRALISGYRNTEVEVSVETATGGIVVLHDTWHPWWRATRNGEPVEIMRANLYFRGVAVPPGRHVVRFRFEPFAGALSQLLGHWRAIWR